MPCTGKADRLVRQGNAGTQMAHGPVTTNGPDRTTRRNTNPPAPNGAQAEPTTQEKQPPTLVRTPRGTPHAPATHGTRNQPGDRLDHRGAETESVQGPPGKHPRGCTKPDFPKGKRTIWPVQEPPERGSSARKNRYAPAWHPAAMSDPSTARWRFMVD